MKKLLMILGALFVIILIVLGILAAVFIPRALKLDRDATAYIQNVFPKIVEHWDSQELVNRATPQLISNAKSGTDLDRLFILFRQLGALRHLDTPKGSVSTGRFTGAGSVTIGNYSAEADFEKGHALVQIQLVRVENGWKINGFRINSDALLPPKR